MGMKSKFFITVCLISFSAIVFSSTSAFAVPVLYGSVPSNNSYVVGGDMLFIINVSDADLDDSSTKLTIKSEDAGSWDEHSLVCESINATDWKCSKTISFDIVGSDTVELFYFTAENTTGHEGQLGNSSYPLMFTSDLNSPVVAFRSVSNGTYVKGSQLISVSVSDSASGVNSSSVMYSFDEVVWNSMQQSAESGLFEYTFDTTSYANDDNITIYARASDVIGNSASAGVFVYIDNEIPTIEIIEPSGGAEITGIMHLEINSTDEYSGIDSAMFNVEGGDQISMDCAEVDNVYVCDEYFDTSSVNDGLRTVTINVYDAAGNSNSDAVDITLDNTDPYLSITNPEGNDYVRVDINITASVFNNVYTISGVDLRVAGSLYDETNSMTCDSSWNCHFDLETSSLTDGAYTLTSTADVIGATDLTHTVDITIDNTIPDFTIDKPSETVVDAIIYPKVIVIDDYGVDGSSVTYNISNFSKAMLCSEYIAGKKYVCSDNFDTTQLSDDYYDIIFYAEDLAGNSGTATRTILTDNFENEGPSPDEMTTTTTLESQTTTTQSSGSSESSGGTTETKTLPGKVIEKITTHVMVLFGNVQKSFETGDTGTLKAFGISMIIFLLVIAVLRTSGIRNLLFGSKGEVDL